MNKLTKNKIFFNLEKIIALTTVVGIVILTIFCMSSCNNSKPLVFNYNIKLNKIFQFI